MPRTNLAVRVAGAEFGIAGEMRRLPAYFDNPEFGRDPPSKPPKCKKKKFWQKVPGVNGLKKTLLLDVSRLGQLFNCFELEPWCIAVMNQSLRPEMSQFFIYILENQNY